MQAVQEKGQVETQETETVEVRGEQIWVRGQCQGKAQRPDLNGLPKVRGQGQELHCNPQAREEQA